MLRRAAPLVSWVSCLPLICPGEKLADADDVEITVLAAQDGCQRSNPTNPDFFTGSPLHGGVTRLLQSRPLGVQPRATSQVLFAVQSEEVK